MDDIGRVTRIVSHVDDWENAFRRVISERRTGSLTLNFNQGVVSSADWATKPEKTKPHNQELTLPSKS